MSLRDRKIALALSAQLTAWKGSDDMATRAKRADLADFDRIMAKVPDAKTPDFDRLPDGYRSSGS